MTDFTAPKKGHFTYVFRTESYEHAYRFNDRDNFQIKGCVPLQDVLLEILD